MKFYSASYIATFVTFFVGLYIMFVFFNPFRNHSGVLGAKTYTEPTYTTQRPEEPEIVRNEGTALHKDNAYIVVFPETVSFNAYISEGITEISKPINLCHRYQITPVYEYWIRSFHNDAKVLSPKKKSMISIKYNLDDLVTDAGTIFSQDSLKMVHSPDGGVSWTMLKNSAVDTQNQTVTAITDIGGGYMLMAGFVDRDSLCSYRQPGT